MKIGCQTCKQGRPALAHFRYGRGVYRVTCLHCGKDAGPYDVLPEGEEMAKQVALSNEILAEVIAEERGPV